MTDRDVIAALIAALQELIDVTGWTPPKGSTTERTLRNAKKHIESATTPRD